MRWGRVDPLPQVVGTLVARHARLPAGSPPPDPDRPLTDLGLGSLAVVGLLVDLEETLGVRFGPELLDERTFRSVRTVTEAVRTLGARVPAEPDGRP